LCIFLIGWSFWGFREYIGVAAAFGNLLLSVAFGWIIFLVSNQISGSLGMVLNQSFLKYTGKISYGIYLYHLFVAQMISLILYKAGITISNHMIGFLLFGCATFGVATASWFLIEKPIAGFKNRLGGRERAAVEPLLAPAGL
jgi:peptidoglycan/LPS O-acetylase OafA/YrhL